MGQSTWGKLYPKLILLNQIMNLILIIQDYTNWGVDDNGNEEPIDAENLQCGDMTKDGTWHAADCANPKPYHCKLTPGNLRLINSVGKKVV